MKCAGLENIPQDDFFCTRCKKAAPLTVLRAKENYKKTQALEAKKEKERQRAQARELKLKERAEKKKMKKVKTANGIDKSFVAAGSHKRKECGRGAGQQNAKAKKARKMAQGEPRDVSEDWCFVCGMGGQLILCDAPKCPKVYHAHCLGASRPDANSADPWYCPWHFCTVCGDLDENMPDRKTACVATQLAVPGIPGAYVPSVYAQESGFRRCCNCCTALCTKHANATVASPDGSRTLPGCGEALQRIADKRNPENAFFACMHCRDPMAPPKDLSLAKYLHRTWNTLLVRFNRLVSPFLVPIEVLVETAVGKLGASETSPPIGLGAIRAKIWQLEYASLESFENDVHALTLSVQGMLKDGKYPAVTEAANSIPIILSKIVARAKRLKTVPEIPESVAAKIRARRGASFWSGNAHRAARSSGMIPYGYNPWEAAALDRLCARKSENEEDAAKLAADAFRAGLSPEELGTARRRSLDDVSRFVSDIPGGALKNEMHLRAQASERQAKARKGITVEHPDAIVAPRQEAMAVAAACLAAMDAALPDPPKTITDFVKRLPPSRGDVFELIDQQSRHLRAALVSTATLRKALQATFDSFDGSQERDEDGESMLTLGELRVAAEYKASNRVLRAELQRVRAELELERRKNEIRENAPSSHAQSAD